MDAVTAIMNDHRVMEKLFASLRLGEGDIAKTVAEVKARLLAHSVAEEEHVYPELVREDPGERGQVHHGVEEHREAEEKLTALEQAVGTDGYADALKEFIHSITHHVEEEEMEILPELREELPAAKLKELGRMFERRRIEELRGHGIREQAEKWDENVSKEDLYNQAREAGIQGRSEMSKEELRKALRKV